VGVVNVCYYVRPSRHNEALRYSLRSLVNLPHERVWLVGHKPDWVTGVEHIDMRPVGSPQSNAIALLRAACEAVSGRFVVMNDDFYVMEPTSVPSWHAGPLSERVRTAAGAYRNHLRAASERLPSDALAWTLHIPVVVESDALADVLSGLGGKVPPEWRTMYGNLTGATGERAADVKVRRRSDPVPAGPFLSSSAGSFGTLLPLLRKRFPQPSGYES
jgi:hypothetical protein